MNIKHLISAKTIKMSSNIALYAAVIVIMLMVFPEASRTQIVTEDSAESQLCMSTAIGGASHRMALSIDIAYFYGHHIFFARVNYMAEFIFERFFPFGEWEPPPASKDMEYSLLYGHEIVWGLARISISTGVSLVRSIHTIDHIGRLGPLLDYSREDVTSFGVPVTARVHFGRARGPGPALTYFTNINKHYRYSGFLLSITFPIDFN